MNKPKVVIFNMTARSGKDLAVKHLMKWYTEAKHLAFKDKLIEAAAAIVNVSVGEFLEDYDKQVKDCSDGNLHWARSIGMEDNVWWKDVPLYDIECASYSTRELLIHASENVMKPVFGKGVFGHAVASEITDNGLYFISDGGFDEEITPILEKAEVLIFKRDRLGNGWEGDSRGWLDKSFGDQIYVPDEIQEEEVYLDFVLHKVREWLRKGENTSPNVPL